MVPVRCGLEAVAGKRRHKEPRPKCILHKAQEGVTDADHCRCLCSAAALRCRTHHTYCHCSRLCSCWQPEQQAGAVGGRDHGELEHHQHSVEDCHRCLGRQQVDAPGAAGTMQAAAFDRSARSLNCFKHWLRARPAARHVWDWFLLTEQGLARAGPAQLQDRMRGKLISYLATVCVMPASASWKAMCMVRPVTWSLAYRGARRPARRPPILHQHEHRQQQQNQQPLSDVILHGSNQSKLASASNTRCSASSSIQARPCLTSCWCGATGAAVSCSVLTARCQHQAAWAQCQVVLTV